MQNKLLDYIEVNPSGPAKGCIILLHGLGANGHDFVDIVPQLNIPNIRFIFPHAPVQAVTINGGYPMPAWFDIKALTLEARVDIDGIQIAEQAVHQLIAQQIEYGIPAQQIVLAGFSQGGALALWTGLHYPEQLGGIMGLSTYLPNSPKLLAEVSTANQKTPIFLAHGTVDTVIPLSWANFAKEYLQQHHYQVTWHTYNMPHSVCLAEIEDMAAWLHNIFY